MIYSSLYEFHVYVDNNVIDNVDNINKKVI
jgi:hypothetical protein